MALGGNDLPPTESPPALADDNEFKDDDDGVDDSCVIESHVELSKKPHEYSPYVYVPSLYWL